MNRQSSYTPCCNKHHRFGDDGSFPIPDDKAFTVSVKKPPIRLGKIGRLLCRKPRRERRQHNDDMTASLYCDPEEDGVPLLDAMLLCESEDESWSSFWYESSTADSTMDLIRS